MKIICKLLLLISVVFCSSFSFVFAEQATEIPAEIILNKVVFSKGVYTISASLKGEARQGDRIIAECYSDDGNLKETREFDFIPDMEIVYSAVLPSDFARIIWMDAEQTERCEPVDVRFNILYALDWMDLAEAISFITNEYAGKVERLSNDPAYASGRLIVKVQDKLPDLSDYHPELTVIDDENHYYIQFLRDEDAISCAEFLSTLENVIYVEPDSTVYAIE